MWSTTDEDTIKKNALNVCQDFLAGSWRNVKIEDFRMTKMSGGYSNKLYKCYVDKTALTDDLNPKEVLLRINGPIKKEFEALIQEEVVNAILVERGLAPKLYGVFDQGRLEEFIPSVTPKLEQMPDLCTSVARELAKIHCLHIPTRKIARKSTEVLLGYVENNTNLDKDQPNPKWKHIVCSRELRRELEWTRKLTAECDSPIIFCHNDIRAGNILLRDDNSLTDGNKKIFIIDYEYAHYNERGYDIAGVFINMCFSMDTKDYPHFKYYLNNFPDQKIQELFIEAYFEQMSKAISFPENFNLEKEKQKILKEIQVFRMLFVLIAAVWSFHMLTVTKKDEFKFGFLEFAESNLEFYEMFKKEYLENQ